MEVHWLLIVSIIPLFFSYFVFVYFANQIIFDFKKSAISLVRFIWKEIFNNPYPNPIQKIENFNIIPSFLTPNINKLQLNNFQKETIKNSILKAYLLSLAFIGILFLFHYLKKYV